MSKSFDNRKIDSVKITRRNFCRFYFLFFILLLCSIFYYVGEIIDFFGWKSLRLEFFYSVHDV